MLGLRRLSDKEGALGKKEPRGVYGTKRQKKRTTALRNCVLYNYAPMRVERGAIAGLRRLLRTLLLMDLPSLTGGSAGS